MLFVWIFSGFGALMLIFICCEFGQRFSNAYDELNDAVNRMDWYLIPIDLHRILLIVMINTQKPLDVNFFGSISCSREQFKRVSVLPLPPICKTLKYLLKKKREIN